jgi:hypothetical protein
VNGVEIAGLYARAKWAANYFDTSRCAEDGVLVIATFGNKGMSGAAALIMSAFRTASSAGSGRHRAAFWPNDSSVAAHRASEPGSA